ncbi:50S ribosomal protein L18 [Salidesulfovibrio onnuriiensis]|uniref:50S ribosomal protein L18 n=1 Tax=Salidesulfovibrio onnuriiensis TaxID=2583823 RepID=UPI0011CCC6F4|nr:50S ribosomal protein L18 [Salidesulfovibrio onnuriiensis]
MAMTKEQARRRRKIRIRKRISGTAERPRLVVFRSNKHLYAQLVDDNNGKTLATASTQLMAKDGEALKPNRESAAKVGKEIAAKALEQKIESVVFDRNGYIYHGKIKALADGAREGGLKF